MLITETQTVKQFSDESEFESTLYFSLEKSDVEDWVVVENDAQELSLSLANWKKLVEMGNKIIIPIENSKSEKGILDNLNSKQLDELEVILKKNRILYNEEEAENLLTHFAVEIQRQNKIGQIPIDIIGWFERNKEKFRNK